MDNKPVDPSVLLGLDSSIGVSTYHDKPCCLADGISQQQLHATPFVQSTSSAPFTYHLNGPPQYPHHIPSAPVAAAAVSTTTTAAPFHANWDMFSTLFTPPTHMDLSGTSPSPLLTPLGTMLTPTFTSPSAPPPQQLSHPMAQSPSVTNQPQENLRHNFPEEPSNLPSLQLETTQPLQRQQGAPYLCDYPGCQKTFTRPYNLKSHRRTHTAERPFACPHCSKRFARLHDRNRHAKLHLGIKPYPCTYCNKAFARQDALNRHLRVDVGSADGLPPCAISNVQPQITENVTMSLPTS